MPRVIGARYGKSSKDFDTGKSKAEFEELEKPAPRNHFTVGIIDDVSHTSLDYDRTLDVEPEGTVRCVFFGLGADGTVGANKNSVKILSQAPGHYAQAYFDNDSHKSGGETASHLRFGKSPIAAPYLIRHADFVACHKFSFLTKRDVLGPAIPGGTFLLNSPYGPNEVWEQLPRQVQKQIIEKRLRFYVIDASAVALRIGLGPRVNTILQTCFFHLADVLPPAQAVAEIKRFVEKTYAGKGEAVVKLNFAAVDAAVDALHEVKAPVPVTISHDVPPSVAPSAPLFVGKVTG